MSPRPRDDLSGPDPSVDLEPDLSLMGQADLKRLNPGMSRHLSQKTESLLPDTIQALATHNRCILLEIACSQESILTRTMQDITGSEKSAQRLSLWNHVDLSTNNGIRSILDRIDQEPPQHVWLSMECGPYSVMQNVNQRTPEQQQALEEKRKTVLKQYVGGAIVYQYCIQKGIHCTWEWAQSCQAWRLPLVQHIMKRYQVYFAITRGCQVDLKDPKGQFISKGWKMMTTNKCLAKRMELPCVCPSHVVHVPCEGSLTRKTAFYTRPFAKRVCEALLQGSFPDQIQKEFEGVLWGATCLGKGCSVFVKRVTDMERPSSVACAEAISPALWPPTNRKRPHVTFRKRISVGSCTCCTPPPDTVPSSTWSKP